MRCDSRFENSDSDSAGKTSGVDLARRVFHKYRTRNVFELAESSGVKIAFQKWFPVTFGEFDWRTKTIYVNENARIELEKIIAHELGHYFLREFEIKKDGDEESFCDEFADELLREGLAEPT